MANSKKKQITDQQAEKQIDNILAEIEIDLRKLKKEKPLSLANLQKTIEKSGFYELVHGGKS